MIIKDIKDLQIGNNYFRVVWTGVNLYVYYFKNLFLIEEVNYIEGKTDYIHFKSGEKLLYIKGKLKRQWFNVDAYRDSYFLYGNKQGVNVIITDSWIEAIKSFKKFRKVSDITNIIN
jgi:hypothetical protein